jgi:hypothetical protein
MFKVMIVLIGPINGEGALRILKHGEAMEFSGESWKAYERRLMGIITRDPASKGRAGEVGRKRVEQERSRRGSTSLSPPAEEVRGKKAHKSNVTVVPEADDEGQEDAEDEGTADHANDSENEEPIGGNGGHVDLDLELDVDNDWELGLPSTQQLRDRSPSVDRQVSAGRKKMVKRY